ncbi:MAG: heat-inducible transcription repressor HrcA [Oscillospiraceae bacterium]|nr:heat-inducible transcription repressor HrcA [Oscillospiraceae bacterium]
MSLSDRKRRILKAIIDEYIENAEPVGSKVIAARSRLSVSPATIRNEMSELEELGYLEQPHISAGRVPSTAGYRLYVNELMQTPALTVREAEAINSALSTQMRELEKMLREFGSLVSRLTNYTTYTLTTRASSETVRKFDVFLIDEQTAIAVIVTSSGLLRNKRIKLPCRADEAAISRVARIANSCFTERTLDEISLSLIKRAASEAGNLSELVMSIAEFAGEVLDENREGDVYIDGISRILSHPEYRDPEKAQELLRYLTDKQELIRHTQEHFSGNREEGAIRFSIGTENSDEPLRDAGIVYGSYDLGKNLQGVIGIVGPRRMDYAKVAANLNYFITGFNKLLKDSFFNE